jgi:hypothetical protein
VSSAEPMGPVLRFSYIFVCGSISSQNYFWFFIFLSLNICYLVHIEIPTMKFFLLPKYVILLSKIHMLEFQMFLDT